MSTRNLSAAALATFLALAAALPALAQNTRSQPQQPQSPQAPVELSPTATELRPIGLKIYLPPETNTRTEFIAGGKSKTVIQPIDSSWVLQIFNSISRDKELTPAAALDAIVEQRQQDFLVRLADRRRVSPLQVMDRVDDLNFAGKQAARAYLHWPEQPTVPVTGYTLVRTNPGEFVIFQIDIATDALSNIRPMYETIIASAEWTDRVEQDEARRFAARSAIRFMESISSEDLEAVLPEETQYLRVYRPHPGGVDSDAEEIGYQIVEVRKGQAGEIDPNRRRTSWGPADREWGLLATVSARTVLPDAVIDSRAIAFLSNDRENELWTILMEMKAGSTVQKSELLLIRRGLRLTAKTTLPGQPPIEREDLLPDAEQGQYLSFVERLLLPRLVAHKNPAPDPVSYDFAYYNFDPRRGGVTLRQDTFEKLPNGAWTGTTIPFEGHEPWTTRYNSEGAIVQRTISPVEVMENVTLQKLRRLWSGRDLPINR